MKKILVACDHPQMDAPLRRSLAHLVKSCEIDVVHDGYAAFAEISAHPFDLIVVDFLLPGIDSLELAESVQYIDPGVPVILILQKEHKAIQKTSHYFKAQSIISPFKPLKFLRLVDKLLHQQLNRYRQLAGTLESTLAVLSQHTGTPCVFLVEETGQILVAQGEVDEAVLTALGNLAVGVSVLDEELKRLFARNETLHTHYQQMQKDHGLYVVYATETLRLALLSLLSGVSQQTDEIWQLLDQAALNIQQAFDRYQGLTLTDAEQPEISAQDHVFIPLALEVDKILSQETSLPDQDDEADPEDEVAVNWAIISNNSNLLTRLHDLTQSDK